MNTWPHNWHVTWNIIGAPTLSTKAYVQNQCYLKIKEGWMYLEKREGDAGVVATCVVSLKLWTWIHEGIFNVQSWIHCRAEHERTFHSGFFCRKSSSLTTAPQRHKGFVVARGSHQASHNKLPSAPGLRDRFSRLVSKMGKCKLANWMSLKRKWNMRSETFSAWH